MVILPHSNNSNKSSITHETTPICTTLAKCPGCNNEKIIMDSESGEVICSSVAECFPICYWKLGLSGVPFAADETEAKARTGMPKSLARHDMGLSTIIGRADRDASGNKLDPTMRIRIYRLATWDMRSRLHTPKDRSSNQAFFQLDVLKDKCDCQIA